MTPKAWSDVDFKPLFLGHFKDFTHTSFPIRVKTLEKVASHELVNRSDFLYS